MKLTTKLAVGLGAMALLTPLGLILPAYFKASTAWGEWGRDEIGTMAGTVPQGLAKLGERWKAPMPDYAFPSWENRGLQGHSLAYVVAALLGAGLVGLAAWWLGRFLAAKEK